MSEFLNVLKIVGWVVLGFAVFQVVLRVIRRNWHFPAPPFFAAFLNNPLRKISQNPEMVIARSGIKPGDQVLEIGCGGGFFLPYAAQAVGEGGKVNGLDISTLMLRHTRKYLAKFSKEIQDRVRLVQRTAYKLPFDDGSLDVVYFVGVLMEIPDPQRSLAEVWRVLKPQGAVAVTEVLPDPDYPGRRTTIRCVEKAGFKVESVEGNLWNYTVRARKG